VMFGCCSLVMMAIFSSLVLARIPLFFFLQKIAEIPFFA